MLYAAAPAPEAGPGTDEELAQSTAEVFPFYEHARARGLALRDVLATPGSVPGLLPGAARAVEAFSELLQRARARLRTEPLAGVARGLLAEVGFEQAARRRTPRGRRASP